MGHSLRHGLTILLALATSCSPFSPLRAADPPANHTRVARIYLQVNAADGAPVGYLSARNFFLTSANRTLSFTLANSTLRRRNKASLPPTHLLVVPGPFLQGVQRPCEQLASLLKARWRVQLLDTSNALRGQSTCPGGSIQVVHGSELQALEALERADGRRVLLYLTTANRPLSHALQQSLAKAGITMYDVGGREPYFIDIQQYPAPSFPTKPAEMSAAAVEATTLGPANVMQPGVARPKASLKAALHDAISDAAGYYVLTTRLDGAVDSLSLKLRHTQPGWTAVARVGVGHGPVPTLELTQ